MLTKIEIDGFKTFRRFHLDIPPFLVVLGRNASGKSHPFDAIDFLHLAADRSLAEVVAQGRGDLHELLHTAADGTRMPSMRFAVEVLLDPEVTFVIHQDGRAGRTLHLPANEAVSTVLSTPHDRERLSLAVRAEARAGVLATAPSGSRGAAQRQLVRRGVPGRQRRSDDVAYVLEHDISLTR